MTPAMTAEPSLRLKLSDATRRALHALVGLPARLGPGSRSTVHHVPIARLREVLDLPAPPHLDLLGPERWLAGGSVLRWISRRPGGAFGQPGDFDLFFPTPEALYRTAEELLARGFIFRTYRARGIFCQLCGGPAELLREGELATPTMPLWRARCPRCGDFGGADAHTLTADRLLRFTADQARSGGVLALELTSPADEIFHLSLVLFRPTLLATISEIDLGLNQFGLDDRDLHFGPTAWPDLLRGRIRWLQVQVPRQNCYRIRKYQALGFRPTLGTRLRYLYWQARTKR